MPAPVLVGIPWLATILVGLFSLVVEFLLKFFTKKVAVTVAFTATIVALSVAFIAVIEGLVSALAVSLPSGAVSLASQLIPSNATACIGAVSAGLLARWVFDWNVRIAEAAVNS